jgi:hypothetical protein
MTQASPSRIDTQLQRGVSAIGAVLTYWMGRSGHDGGQLVRLASWALGEDGCLDTGQISRIRNARLARGCNLKNLLAFDAVNVALWTWQIKGQQAAWERYGPHTPHGIRELWLDDGHWLPVPEDTTEPLQFPDFADILAGRLELPYIGGVALVSGDAQVVSEALSDLLNADLQATGLPPREGLRKLLEAYPIQDADRRSRLMALVVGTGIMTRDELETELHALSEAIRAVRGLKPGSYGPGHLTEELSRRLPAS